MNEVIPGGTVRSPAGAKSRSRAKPTLRERYADLQGRGALEVVVLFVVLQSFCALWYFLDTKNFNYLSAANLSVMTQSGSWLAMLAVGSGIVMMVGEIDLSVGANVGMSSIVFLTWYQGGRAPWVCIVMALLTGVAIGLFNGLLVNFTKIPSLIATLGTLGLVWGIQIWYTGGDNMEAPRVKEFNRGIVSAITGEWFHGMRAQLLWAIGIGAVMWLVMHRHRLGNHIMAVGGNEQAARAISIRPKRVRLWAFGLLGLLAGLGAIMLSVQGKTMLPGNTIDYNLDAIAAAVIGGTAVKGGKGSVLGMILGTFILKTFQAIVLLSSIFPAFYLKVFTGGMLVIFATLNQWFENRAG
jgi:simple sugar transport system permease protein